MEFPTYLYKSAIVLALFYVGYRFLLRKDTLFAWNRYFLLLGVAVSLLLPLWEITQTVIIEIPASLPDQSLLSDNTAAFLSSENASDTQNSFDYGSLITYLYIGGLFFFGLQWLRQAWSLVLTLTRYPKFFKEGIYHVQIHENQAPFSFMNYVVYNPDLHSEHELDMILKHEIVHAREHHSIDMIVSQLFTIIQWFNPFAWYYRKAVSENLEFLADRRTLSKIACPKSYQLALVRTSSVVAAPMLANSFYQSFIKKRIVMLNKNHSSRCNALKALFVVPFLALFLYGFNFKTQKKFVEIPLETKVESPAENEVKMDPKDFVSIAVPTEKEASPSLVKIQPIFPKRTEMVSNTVFEGIEISIDKNTSDAELKKIKNELKEKFDIDFNYSLMRNSTGEITSLSISYRSNGKSGNYQVTDDEGIEEFIFYRSEDGKTGFYSGAWEERRSERSADIEERRMAMREEMEARREGLEERRVARLADLEGRREKYKVKRMEAHEKKEATKREIHRVRKNRDGEIIVIEKLGEPVHYDIQEHPGTFVVSGHEAAVGVITKNTTDAELKKMKTELANEGIDFNYRNVKRNSKGEIKGIKFTVTDDRGKSTTHVKGNNDDPIDSIIIQ